jgi:acyl-CoA dehydrogenase family member 9
MDLSSEKPSRSSAASSPAKPLPSFGKSLFHGTIRADRVLPFPRFPESEREVLALTLEAIEKLKKEIDVFAIEEAKKIPDELMTRFKEMGLFGLIIPEEYGGFGFSTSAYVQTISALAMIDASITATVGAHQSIGLKALLMFGTDEQKKEYLPRLATGEWLAAFGLTEPGAGSDVRSLRTNAVLSADKSHYVLNGEKIWITNGGLAHFFTVFAKTSHEDGKGGKKDKLTAFIVTRDMEGFSSGPEEKKMGLFGSSTTSLAFENVRVPAKNVIGEPGEGFKVAVAVLNNGRMGLAGACAFGSKSLIQAAMDHALQRKQFGQPLAQFELIQSKFAHMVSDTYAAESMVRLTTDIMDRGDWDYSLETAMCKVFCTESEWRTANECLQIAGGTGYMREYGYEKVVRDSRIFTIWEGANEILRLFIGLSGLQGPGEKLSEISKVLKKPMDDVLHSLGVLSDFGVRWIQRRVTVADQIEGVHPSLNREEAVIESYTTDFGKECEKLLLKYGKNVLNAEIQVRRVADIAIDLYAMVATVARTTRLIEERGEEKTAQEVRLTRLFCRKARRRIAENFRRLNRNDDDLEVHIANSFYEEAGYSKKGYFN